MFVNHVLLFATLWANGQAWQLNLEAKGGDRACLSDDFPGNLVIKIEATLIEHINLRGYIFAMTVEDEQKNLIAKAHHTSDSGRTYVEFLNSYSKTLQICVDNYLSKSIAVSLEIKLAEFNSDLNEETIKEKGNTSNIASRTLDLMLAPGRWIGDVLEHRMPSIYPDNPLVQKSIAIGLALSFSGAALTIYLLLTKRFARDKIKSN